MITRTIGVGGDYANFDLALEAYAVGLLADDLTLNQISADIAEPALSGSRQVNLNGHTLRITCSYNEANPDDWQNWYKLNCGASTGLKVVVDGAAGIRAGNVVVDYMYIVWTSGAVGGLQSCLLIIDTNFMVSQQSIDRCHIDGNNGAGSDLNCISISQDVAAQTTVTNCKLWGAKRSIYVDNNAYGTTVIEDCTMRSTYAAFDAFYAVCYIRGSGITNIINSVATQPGFALLNGFCYRKSTIDSADVKMNLYNSASEDARITGYADIAVDCEENITPADEYQALDDTNEKFLFLLDGSKWANAGYAPSVGAKPLPVQFNADIVYNPGEGVLAQGGTAPTYAGDTDLAGDPRPNEGGYYAIGCHEQRYNPIYSRDV